LCIVKSRGRCWYNEKLALQYGTANNGEIGRVDWIQRYRFRQFIE